MKHFLNVKLASMGRAIAAASFLLLLCAIASPHDEAEAAETGGGARQGAKITTSSRSAWRSMTFSTTTGLSGESILLASGEVGPTSAADLSNALAIATRAGEKVTLYIDSPGGDFIGGLELGRTIRSAGVSTVVGSITSRGETAGVCASACVYAFIGGVERSIATGSRIGLHQMRAEQGRVSASEIQSAAGMALMHTLEMGVSAEAMIAALVIGHNDIYWFSDDDLLRTGLTTPRFKNPDRTAQRGADMTTPQGGLISVRPTPQRDATPPPPPYATPHDPTSFDPTSSATDDSSARSPLPAGVSAAGATGLFSRGSNRGAVTQPENVTQPGNGAAGGSWLLISDAHGARLEGGGPRASHDGGPGRITLSCQPGHSPSATITVDGSGLARQTLDGAVVSAIFSTPGARLTFRQDGAAMSADAASHLSMTARIPVGFSAALVDGGAGELRIWAEEAVKGAASRDGVRAAAMRRLSISVDAPDKKTIANFGAICKRMEAQAESER